LLRTTGCGGARRAAGAALRPLCCASAPTPIRAASGEGANKPGFRLKAEKPRKTPWLVVRLVCRLLCEAALGKARSLSLWSPAQDWWSLPRSCIGERTVTLRSADVAGLGRWRLASSDSSHAEGRLQRLGEDASVKGRRSGEEEASKQRDCLCGDAAGDPRTLPSVDVAGLGRWRLASSDSSHAEGRLVRPGEDESIKVPREEEASKQRDRGDEAGDPRSSMLVARIGDEDDGLSRTRGGPGPAGEARPPRLLGASFGWTVVITMLLGEEVGTLRAA